MTALFILQNWKEYDTRKQKSGDNPRYFDCMQKWETDFLIRKIKYIYTFIPELSIVKAIEKVCSQDKAAAERHAFVCAVLEHLIIQA